MKGIVDRLSLVLVVFAGAVVAFWAGSSRAQGTNRLMLATDFAASRRQACVASATKRWEPPDGLLVHNIPPQCVLSATLDAPRGGKVLVMGDVTFRPTVDQWVGIQIALVQGDATVAPPHNHYSYGGSNGTFFNNLAFSTVLEIPHGGSWTVQLLAAAVTPTVAHTAHVSAVYLGE